MDEKMVAKSVVKKLSALRATLSDEEQAALDRMVEGDYAEGHLRIQPATDERVFAEADEAVAHLRIQPAAERAARDADEAVAHLRIQPATDAKVAYRVIYNPDDETYNVE